MNPPGSVAGGLFAGEFLAESVRELPQWKEARADLAAGVAARLRDIRSAFPAREDSNEAITEDEFIWKVLGALGWTAALRQQNLSLRGHYDIPDGLLFTSEADKNQALGVHDEPHRYAAGVCLVESKRWGLDLDRASGAHRIAPATQMLRYLAEARVVTGGRLRWGILTNGARWRLYRTDARSVADEFFEVDLEAALTGAPTLFAPTPEEAADALTLFVLFFRRDAFHRRDADWKNVLDRAVEGGRFLEERVAADLSEVVFREVFPSLVRAIAAEAGDAPLGEVRDAALVLLYRLLFILYAEDRGLLPVDDAKYRAVGLRHRVRSDIAARLDRGEAFSAKATGYWHAVADLCRVIDEGDPAFGLPPYNGGLFDPGRAPLLDRIALGNAALAPVVDAMACRRTAEGRRYISYRDLSVQQLGSIYERLLEHEVARDGAGVVVRPNALARKDSGSYYTPESLVRLIIRETLGPKVEDALAGFRRAARDGAERDAAALAEADAASRLLDLRVCDPAMGSGHFLVSLVDYLTDRVIEALAEAHQVAPGYESPVAARIEAIRETIRRNAAAGGWTVAPSQLDDRHLIRRMVLKRCVYGVDKNPMAVELAKVSLWLHSFTVGAPLGFLDHHLRGGDSLFGAWVRPATARALREGGPLFVSGPLRAATEAARPMEAIEALTDAEIAEAAESERLFRGVQERIRPFEAFLSVLHALDWRDDRSTEARAAVRAWLAGKFGDPVAIAAGEAEVPGDGKFGELLAEARERIAEDGFLHWELAFPGVWPDWEAEGERQGGFDAVIGNPPWDRMKLQQVEWFAFRRPEIAGAQRASDRKALIAALERDGAPLADDFRRADARAKRAAEVARKGGDYPLLSGGDVNIYSLFVERGMSLVKPDGAVGLLVPSGIASDKTAARFFRSVATEGRLRALYDFENKKVFFPAVHASFKFCVFVAGRSGADSPARCAFYLHGLSELEDPERRLELTPEDFRRVNPNTGTAPIFRSRRDQEITTAIYRRLPVLVDRSSGEPVSAWPVRYSTMFHMTNDSHRFRTRTELEEKEGAWHVGGNLYDSPSGRFVPLYEGKMVQAFDHRAASVVVNPDNVYRPGQPVPATGAQHGDANWVPDPQFWVAESDVEEARDYALAFKDVTATTNVRTMIAALIPRSGVGNTLPLILPGADESPPAAFWALAAANLNALVFDFIARQKVQSQHLNWFIVEQLPVVPPDLADATSFGPKTATQIITETVLELTYTAHDMAPFAKALGHVDEAGNPLPPFPWNEARRLRLRAKLDALFFHLYGITDRDAIRHIYSTFPIVARHEKAAYGTYRSRDLTLAYLNALTANHPDANPTP